MLKHFVKGMAVHSTLTRPDVNMSEAARSGMLGRWLATGSR